MTAPSPVEQIPHFPSPPRLLVELPSRPKVFFGNLLYHLIPRRPLKLQSAPAPFWPDVFVKPRLPWFSFLESGVLHVIAVTFLLGVARLLSFEPRVEPKPRFDHSQVLYYQPSEYLPTLDTRTASTEPPQQADPAPTRQAGKGEPAEALPATVSTPPTASRYPQRS